MMGFMNGAVMRQSLSEAAISRMIDPRTGNRLRPLGVTRSGRPIYPIMGAAPDDPSDSGGSSSDADKKDPEGTGSNSSGDGGDGDKKSDDEKKKSEEDKGNVDAKIEDLEQEKERHYRRRKEAEQERDDLKKRLEALEGKDTPEAEKLKADFEAVKSENAALVDSLRSARVENAFLRDNSYEWHNPGRALALADMSKVEIDDDGTVHGLKAALDALAKSDPYLIKTAEKKQKETPVSTEPDNPPADKKKSEEKRRADLAAKYPAIRR